MTNTAIHGPPRPKGVPLGMDEGRLVEFLVQLGSPVAPVLVLDVP